MIKVTLGAADDFNIAGFLATPLEGEVTASWTDTKATVVSDSGDSAELTGTFTAGEGTTEDMFAAAEEITGIKLTLDGEVQYTAKGLTLTQDDLQSFKTYSDYLASQSYTIVGNGAANSIEGQELGDKLYGMGGEDDLTGFDGNDLLDGGKGKDRMDGGAGNDTYVIDSAKDTIVEAKDGGNDKATSSSVDVNISKFGDVEDIFLFGKANIDAKGNALNNDITGNDGSNHIWGGKGNDELTGDKGADTFHFGKGDKVDTITDFDASGKGQDLIDLDGFGKLSFKKLDIDVDGKDVVIDFGKGDELVLEGVKLKHIDASDFMF
jgi:Ca2+-binding RTX toxin-like protein